MHPALHPRTCWGPLKHCAAHPAGLAGPGRGLTGWWRRAAQCRPPHVGIMHDRGPWRLTWVSLGAAELAPCLRLKRRGGMPKGQDLPEQEQ